MMARTRAVLLLIAAALILPGQGDAVASPAPAGAGVVQTIDGRFLEGSVVLADGRVDVGGRAVLWADVACVVRESVTIGLGAAGGVHLAGEVWRGQVTGLSNKRVSLRSAFLGVQEVDLGDVTEIEFEGGPPDVAGPGIRAAAGAGVLYREKGEPVPGTLMWIDQMQVAIDSPLGALRLPRQGLVRYVCPVRERAVRADRDQLGLTDGTVMRGTVKPEADSVRVEHAVLGTRTFPASVVQYIRRGDPRARLLCDAAPTSFEEFGLFGKTSATAPAVLAAGGARQPMAALRLMAKTSVTYSIQPPAMPGASTAAGGKVRLAGRARPVDGAGGAARLRVMVGGQAVLDKELGANGPTMPLALDLPEGDSLVIEVDYGSPLGFPCGVILEAPMLVSPGATGGLSASGGALPHWLQAASGTRRSCPDGV